MYPWIRTTSFVNFIRCTVGLPKLDPSPLPYTSFPIHYHQIIRCNKVILTHTVVKRTTHKMYKMTPDSPHREDTLSSYYKISLSAQSRNRKRRYPRTIWRSLVINQQKLNTGCDPRWKTAERKRKICKIHRKIRTQIS